jgi:hypothetical protein
MLTAVFNDPEEFLEDLVKEAERPGGDIARGIVRVTKEVRHTATDPLWNLLVVATYGVDDGQGGVVHLVRLQHFCGQVWQGNPGDPVSIGVHEKSEKVMEIVVEAARALGLEVRAGVLTWGPQT